MSGAKAQLEFDLTAPRAGRFSRQYLEGVAWVFWMILRVFVQEVRNFRRYPTHLRLSPAEGPGLRVVLYGLPYADWNASLSDRQLWQDLRIVSEVRRIPGLRVLLPWSSERTVVIPMKTSHAVTVPQRFRGLIPDRHSARLMADKSTFQQYLVANGLTAYAPATYATPDEASFPCVVKRLDLSASIGVEIATSRRHLDEILQSGVFAGHRWLLQALAPGIVEYASFCVCDEGRIVWDCTFASTMSGPAVIKNEDNGKNREIIATDPDVLRQFETVLKPLRYRGPCVIDYKIAEDGRVQIFEINPRLGGTLLQKAHAGLLREALKHILAPAR
jgi:hypothetical protein